MTVEVWLSGHEENFTRKAIESSTIVVPFHAGIKNKRTGQECAAQFAVLIQGQRHRSNNVYRNLRISNIQKITEELYLLFPKNISISFFRTCTLGLEFN